MAAPAADRPERRSGLGSFGRERARNVLGGKTVAGQKITAYEEQMFGTDRALPPQTTTQWEYPESSRVKAYQYDFGSQQLRVRFHKYNTPWVYEGVPEVLFQAFDSAPSKGRYINSTLNYTAYRKATPDEVSTYFND